MFEIIKLTHVCQYWRSTLISYPHLWSAIFVKNDHKDFVAACLERSREIPLTVRLDLKYGDYHDYPDCICIRKEWTPRNRINEDNPCRYHATIDPLLKVDHIQRIRKLDVHLNLLDNVAKEGPDECFKDALDEFNFFVFALPILESLSFRVQHEFDIDAHMELPRELFCWRFLPPTELRHLALHGCYGGPIQAIRNLTSLELSGDVDAFEPIQLNQRTFLPLISKSPSLVSIHLSHCSFPDRTRLSRVTPFKLSELKSLRLMDIDGLPGFSGLVEVPAFKTLSALRISAEKRKSHFYDTIDFLVRAESDDGFQLLYDTPNRDEVASHWTGVTCDADPSPAFVRFEGKFDPIRNTMEVSPFPFFANAKILEISASFASAWHRDLWKDLGKVGPQLTTLRLEVTEGMDPRIVESVKEFAKARFQKGMSLTKLERMAFEGMSEEDEEKAKKLWEEFRAGLDVDQYLTSQ